MSDDLDLDAIEARVKAATPGPWHNSERGSNGVHTARGECVALTHREPQRHADAAFIAAARTDVPTLLAEVRRLRPLVPWRDR